MATGATALKEPSDAALAQASTHARRRTVGRHRVAQPRTRPTAHRSQAPAPLQGGTRPTHATHQRHQAPPPRTHADSQTPAAHPCSTCAPRMQERPEHTRPLMHPVCPRKQGFLHMAAVRKRLWHKSQGNKIAASAHTGMG
jgi:hypothetical protein